MRSSNSSVFSDTASEMFRSARLTESSEGALQGGEISSALDLNRLGEA